MWGLGPLHSTKKKIDKIIDMIFQNILFLDSLLYIIHKLNEILINSIKRGVKDNSLYIIYEVI